jgi:hypothetical protein
MCYISTGDDTVDQNLRRLDHLASNEHFDADPNSMDNWLTSVIMSVKILPKAVQRHFTGYYFIGDLHYRITKEARVLRWKAMVSELKRHCDAAFNDPVLRHDNPQGRADFSDRPKTRGERILELCDQLDADRYGSPEFDSALSKIQHLAAEGISADVAALKKLSAKKRIPDLSEHRYWIIRHVSHIQTIAHGLHHLL